jgi:DNA (cytosine-5)-methyltransferase 1
MKDKLKIISLCDGMSCGALALDTWLEQQGLTWDDIEYHAFEIDKYSIGVSMYNYPLMYRHGDARNYKNLIGEDIFLLMGGFPCQPYSFSGKGKATEDERDLSNLIFDALKELKPKYFLFENVPMKKEHQDRISEGIGVEPTMINSQDFSAQHRKRLYWTNIKIDGWHNLNKDVVLKDILEDGFADRDKSLCIDANYFKGGSMKMYETKSRRQLVFDLENKRGCQQIGLMVETVKIRKHRVDIPNLQKVLRSAKTSSGKTNRQIAEETSVPITKVEHWFRTDSSFAIPSDNIWYKLKDVIGIDVDTFDKQIMEFEYRDGVYESSQRVYSEHGKSPTLTASNMAQWIETKKKGCRQVGVADIKGFETIKRVYDPDFKAPSLTTMQGGWRQPKVATSELYWRNLTPLECERLQTVPDGYTKIGQFEGYFEQVTEPKDWRNRKPISNTQRYKMLGNGWTVAVISHIMKNMEK